MSAKFLQMQDTSEAEVPEVTDKDVTYYLRDINSELGEAWKAAFADFKDNFKVSVGDIFYDAPSADAIVSPANSFGFMTGGIDLAYTKHFGKQMQERLQKLLRTKYHGELLIGQSVIIPAYGDEEQMKQKDLSNFNQGKPLKWLISAPTMRVGMDVSDTVNAYLAFRGIILAVREHNTTPGKEPIRSVLVPGLATAVGKMPKRQCAWQMLQAYETFVGDTHPNRLEPRCLDIMYRDHQRLIEGKCGPRELRPVAPQ